MLSSQAMLGIAVVICITIITDGTLTVIRSQKGHCPPSKVQHPGHLFEPHVL